MGSASVALTYVPADCGSILPGKSKAPKAFQDVGIVSKLHSAGISSVSEHDALTEPALYKIISVGQNGVRDEDTNVRVCEQVQNSLTKSLGTCPDDAPFQLVLGGECGMLPGVLSALWHHHAGQSVSAPKRVGLVYIDADTDLAAPMNPGFIGTFAGMNMTNLIRGDGALKSLEKFSRPSGEPVCDSSNTVFFGTNMALASNTKDHFGFLFEHNYKVVSASSVARDPIKAAKVALEHLEDKVDVILVHLDVDSIDPQEFPIANIPNFTGVRFETMMEALKVMVTSKKVQGLTIAEVNPNHDPGLHMVGRLTDEVVGMLGARFGNK